MSGRTKALLLAAGLGTRLQPITDRTPKCLIPVAGRPLLDYWFDRFGDAEVRDVLINTHSLREQVKAYLDEINRKGRFQVREAHEPKLLGSAGTVHANRAWADDADTVLIVYADNLSTVNLAAMLDDHRARGGDMTVMLFRSPEPERCGIAQLDAEGRIVEFEEKPKQPKGNLANGGLYAVTPDVYREMADLNAFDLGFDVLPAFAGRMRGWVWDGLHLDIGTPEALKQAETEALKIAGGGVRG